MVEQQYFFCEMHVNCPDNKYSAAPPAHIAVITGPIIIERNMEHVLYRIGSILSKQYTVDLIGPAETSERLRQSFHIVSARKYSGMGFHLLPVFGPRFLAVRQYLKTYNPALFMAVSAIGINGLTAAIAGCLWRRPSIVRVTSDIFRVYRAEPTVFRKIRMFVRNNLLGRLSLRLANRVVVLHEEQARQLWRNPGLKDKIFAVSQPVLFPIQDTAESAVDALRKDWEIPGNAYVVGYVGRLDHGKRPDMLVDTVNLLLGKDSSLHVLIVGDGVCRAWLEDRLSHSGRVHFAGQQPRDELLAYYQLMDVLLHTSKSEGLSTVIAEALFLGVPVVASDSGVITRSLVSNISDTAAGLAERIFTRDYKQDQIPESMLPETNEKLWLALIENVLRDYSSSKIR